MRCFLSLLIVCFLAIPAWAWESDPVVSTRAKATLVAESDSVPSDKTVRIALRLRLTPGWHTYWRNPGEAGVPVELSFVLADGAAAGPIDWPAPDRMLEGTIATYGFSGEVVLPVTVIPPRGEPLPPYSPGDSIWVEIHSLTEATFDYLNQVAIQTNRPGGFSELFTRPLANVSTNIFNENANGTKVQGFFNVGSASGLGKRFIK